MLKRPSYEKFVKRFSSALGKISDEDIMGTWDRNHVPLDRVRFLIWMFCCAPTQKELQRLLFASDQEVDALERRCSRASSEIEKVNFKSAPLYALVHFGIVNPLPDYRLPAGMNLKDMPAVFAALPQILDWYVRTARALAGMEKRFTAKRSLIRCRALVLLNLLVKQHDVKDLFRDVATVLGAGMLAAGNQKKDVGERNLRVAVLRFKKERAQDFAALESLASRSTDPAETWIQLAQLFLVSKNLLLPLPRG